jgi:hypothetical protein
MEALPFGAATSAGGIGVLTLIIIYLLRLNNQDRRDSAERLAAIEAEDDRRLETERADRAEERKWYRDFYENRLEQVSQRYDLELAALRAELADERGHRLAAEEQLRGLQSELATLRSKRATP